MKLNKYSTFYRDKNNNKHFCTWLQHGDEVFDVRDVVVHE